MDAYLRSLVSCHLSSGRLSYKDGMATDRHPCYKICRKKLIYIYLLLHHKITLSQILSTFQIMQYLVSNKPIK